MKKVLLIICGVLLLPLSVRAKDVATLILTCSPDEVAPGGTVECTLNGNTSAGFGGFDADIAVSDNLTIESFKLSDALLKESFISFADNGKIGVSTTGVFQPGDVTIGVITLKVKEEAPAGKEMLNLSSYSVHCGVDNGYANYVFDGEVPPVGASITVSETGSSGPTIPDEPDQPPKTDPDDNDKTDPENPGNQQTTPSEPVQPSTPQPDNSSDNDVVSDDTITNPQTGTLSLLVVFMIMIQALGISYYFYARLKKKNN